MLGREEVVANSEYRNTVILEKIKKLSELTAQRDILQHKMAGTHISKEEEAYENILSRIAEIEADLLEQERVASVVPLTLNAITPNARVLSSAAIGFAVSTPEEYKDEEKQHQQRREDTPICRLTSADITLAVDPQLANKEEIRAQAYRELLNDKQKLQSLEGLIKRLHQLFVNSFDPKAFDLYIEPQVKDRDTGVEYSAFKRLGDFVVQVDAASMLVAGDPGMGKTLLSLQIAQQSWYLFIRENMGALLKDAYWAGVLAAYEQQDFAQIVAPLFFPADEKFEEPATQKTISLPLWLWMPFLRTEKDWEQRLLETHLKQSGLFPEDIALLKQICQQRLLRLLPIMDGWDELPPVKENLYLLSGFWEEEHWPYLKVLSTCRPEAFVHYEKQGGYKSIFHPKQGVGAYTILNLSPFEPRHIDAYVNRYVATLPEDYQPSILSLLPDVPVDQARAWDQAKAAWIADYEANYFKIGGEKDEEAIVGEGFISVADYQEDYFARPRAAESRGAALFGEGHVSVEADSFLADEKEAPIKAVDLPPNETSPMGWQNIKTYQHYLEHIPSLAQLVQTPFILSAVVQVLPSIVMHQSRQAGQSQQSVTRYTIYQYFVDHWLTKQAERLWRDKEKQLDLIDFRMEDEAHSIEKLKACLFTYSENLARLALNLGGGKAEVNLSDRDTLNPNLVIPAPGQTPHFDKEPVEEKKLKLIRSGCLLQNLGNTFKFLHKSLVEFFAAKALFSGAHIAADSYLQRFSGGQNFLKDLSLNEQLLTSEPNIIFLLVDQARNDLDFKYLLYQIIELSKGEPSVEKAAANAITILNAAGESFSGRDFRSVHIRGAILNGALCDQTDFEGADLRDITAHNIWLQKANLSHAQVSGLDFQELPRIKHSAKITNLCIASHGEWLLVTEKGYVKQYGYPNMELLRQWNLDNSNNEFFEISSLALSADNKLVVAAYKKGVHLIDMQNGKLDAYFTPSQTACDEHGHLIKGDYFFVCSGVAFCYTTEKYLAFGADIYISKKVIRPYVEEIRFHSINIYNRYHLQIWDIEKHSFLGEYVTDDSIVQLSACHQGYTLIANTKKTAGTGSDILLFSISADVQGELFPVQILTEIDHFTLSWDERLLAVSQENIIHFYSQKDPDRFKPYFYGPLSNMISLGGETICQALAFSPKGNLLVIRSSAHLHIWDLLSEQTLYILPIPEIGAKRKNSFSVYFFPSVEFLRILVSVGYTLYSWSLNQAIVSIFYPGYSIHSIDLSASLLEKIENSEEQINKMIIKEKIEHLLSKRWWIDKTVTSQKLLISTDQVYLVSAAIGFYKDIYIHVWNLQKSQLHFKVTYSIFFSHKHLYDCFLTIDGQNLVIVWANRIYIHCLDDGKKIAEFATNVPIPSLVALSADKNWLAVVGRKYCLSIFDVSTQHCLFYSSNIPIKIQKLNFTTDSQFIVVSDKKGRALTFRVIQEKGALTVRLIYKNVELNLVCDEVNIEAARGLSQENRLLLEQNNARGTPAPFVAPISAADAPENKEAEQEIDIEIPRELSFDRAIVKRDGVSSFLNTRAVLNYDVWQVALVRDKESKSNSEHTFIVVEGMDAFGRCFFWRFDLVTKIGEEKVEKGFAKVNIQRYNDLLLSERESILQVFLNPHEIQGRGLESLVGHVWQLKREKVLGLYKAIMADQAKDLIPYAITGNQSFFSKGDNCYSWARRHLLALKEPKIQKDLPSTSTDYFVMRPKWKLQESLIAAQHVKREAALGPCRSM
jgi:hypothetical protein